MISGQDQPVINFFPKDSMTYHENDNENENESDINNLAQLSHKKHLFEENDDDEDDEDDDDDVFHSDSELYHSCGGGSSGIDNSNSNSNNNDSSSSNNNNSDNINISDLTIQQQQQQHQVMNGTNQTIQLDSEESSDTSGDISISYEFTNITQNSATYSTINSNANSVPNKSPKLSSSQSLGNFLNEEYSDNGINSNQSSSNSTPLVAPTTSTNISNKGFSNIISPRSLKKTGSMSIANESTWIMILSNWVDWGGIQYQSILTKYIYQGIPDRFRASIWFHLSNLIQQLSPIPSCNDLLLLHSNQIDKLSPNGLVSTLTPISTPLTTTPTIRGSGIIINNNSSNNNHILTSSISNLSINSNSTSPTISPSTSCALKVGHKCFYQSICRHSSEHEEQIRVDIQRSFPDIPDLELKEYYSTSLYNVLKAISLYDSEMGYCQGISFIGSILITKLSEEEVFHVLIRLLEGVMRDFYIVGMRGLKLRIFQLGKLVKDLFPKLHAHLLKIDLDFMIFASPWFLTAFSYHLSEECSVRVLDVILLQGINAFFSVGLAIFQIIEDDLLKCSDSAEAMEFFRCNAKDRIEVSLLMDTASRISVSNHQLSTFSNQFNQESKPSIPSEFNPESTPKEKLKDPKWVVKKYKLKERISNLEHDLAITKQELHYTRERGIEEKGELLKHLQKLSDNESHFIDDRQQMELHMSQLSKENEQLKLNISESKDIHLFLTQELNKLRSKLEKELWKNNPKKSIQFEK